MAGKINKPNAFQKLIHRFWMMSFVSALMARVLHRADIFMLRLTHNRYTFAGLVGLPIIRLTTIGAKSNLPRSLPLVGVIDQERVALIASSYGREHSPGWYYNLKAHPECEVIFKGKSGKYIARELDGEEYNQYWQLAISLYAGYERYKERAAPRHIPVMLLEPKDNSFANLR